MCQGAQRVHRLVAARSSAHYTLGEWRLNSPPPSSPAPARRAPRRPARRRPPSCSSTAGSEFTTADLAAAAGVSEGTIFRYFPDKAALLDRRPGRCARPGVARPAARGRGAAADAPPASARRGTGAPAPDRADGPGGRAHGPPPSRRRRRGRSATCSTAWHRCSPRAATRPATAEQLATLFLGTLLTNTVLAGKGGTDAARRRPHHRPVPARRPPSVTDAVGGGDRITPMSDSAAHLDVTDTDGVRVITWTRPDALNAMSIEMWHGTRDALDSADADGIRCIVLTGQGRAFTVGQDLSEFGDPRHGEPDGGFRGLMRALAEVPVPLVAAVNGIGCRLRSHRAAVVRARAGQPRGPPQGAVRRARRRDRGGGQREPARDHGAPGRGAAPAHRRVDRRRGGGPPRPGARGRARGRAARRGRSGWPARSPTSRRRRCAPPSR